MTTEPARLRPVAKGCPGIFFNTTRTTDKLRSRLPPDELFERNGLGFTVPFFQFRYRFTSIQEFFEHPKHMPVLFDKMTQYPGWHDLHGEYRAFCFREL